jgi:hypothetical protein
MTPAGVLMRQQSNKLHKLRIAWSAVCGIVCLLFVVLWVRSYRWNDTIWRVSSVSLPTTLTHIRFSSNSGAIFGVKEDARYSLSLQVAKRDRWQYYRSDAAKHIPSKFLWHASPNRKVVSFPHWFGVTMLATFTALVSPLIPWHFSLRTLLVATTLVAVLLAAITYAVR